MAISVPYLPRKIDKYLNFMSIRLLRNSKSVYILVDIGLYSGGRSESSLYASSLFANSIEITGSNISTASFTPHRNINSHIAPISRTSLIGVILEEYFTAIDQYLGTVKRIHCRCYGSASDKFNIEFLAQVR